MIVETRHVDGDPRVKTLKGVHMAGMKSDSLTPDASPWVRAGLEALEKGVKLTPELLQEADNSGYMGSPKRKKKK